MHQQHQGLNKALVNGVAQSQQYTCRKVLGQYWQGIYVAVPGRNHSVVYSVVYITAFEAL